MACALTGAAVALLAASAAAAPAYAAVPSAQTVGFVYTGKSEFGDYALAICVHPAASRRDSRIAHATGSVSPMAVSLRFRCQFCARQADPPTQSSLEKTVGHVAFAMYVDAMPEKWLVWTGRGQYGPARYSCPDHRGDLVAYLREHYGTLGDHPWKRPPYPTEIPNADPETVKNLLTSPRRGNAPPVQ